MVSVLCLMQVPKDFRQARCRLDKNFLTVLAAIPKKISMIKELLPCKVNTSEILWGEADTYFSCKTARTWRFCNYRPNVRKICYCELDEVFRIMEILPQTIQEGLEKWLEKIEFIYLGTFTKPGLGVNTESQYVNVFWLWWIQYQAGKCWL